jgi:hypothetical protein
MSDSRFAVPALATALSLTRRPEGARKRALGPRPECVAAVRRS